MRDRQLERPCAGQIRGTRTATRLSNNGHEATRLGDCSRGSLRWPWWQTGPWRRVPTPNVSLIELVFCTKKEITKEKINDAFAAASKKQSKRVLEITTEELVSVDFNHNSASAIIDASLTNVVGDKMGKISAWYDNEWGFSNRMCDIAEHLHKIS